MTANHGELRQYSEKRNMWMKKWNLETFNMNHKQSEDRRVKQMQRLGLGLEDVRKKQEQVQERRQILKDEKKPERAHKKKPEESMTTQDKSIAERDERRLQEKLKQKQRDVARRKEQEDERRRRAAKKKMLEQERDEEEQRRINADMARWRQEEDHRRTKEEKWRVQPHEQMRLELQRQRVEEVMTLSRALALKKDDSGHSEKTHQDFDEEDERSKENQHDQLYILEKTQQEEEEESRREAQQQRYKRYQEERQCRTLEDDLQKLVEKASAMASLNNDSDSSGALDDMDSRGSYNDHPSARSKKLSRGEEEQQPTRKAALTADQPQGMTYLFSRLEEEKKKQTLLKTSRVTSSRNEQERPKKHDSFPKSIGQPYASTKFINKRRGVLEPIPFLKFDGSPCFNQGAFRHIIIRR